MNQDNNFNQNNFNSQGNNGISNNQNINNNNNTYMQQTQFNSTNMYQQPIDNKTPKKSKLGLIVGSVAIAVIIIGIGIYFIFNSNDNNVNNLNNNNSNVGDNNETKLNSQESNLKFLEEYTYFGFTFYYPNELATLQNNYTGYLLNDDVSNFYGGAYINKQKNEGNEGTVYYMTVISSPFAQMSNAEVKKENITLENIVEKSKEKLIKSFGYYSALMGDPSGNHVYSGDLNQVISKQEKTNINGIDMVKVEGYFEDTNRNLIGQEKFIAYYMIANIKDTDGSIINLPVYYLGFGVDSDYSEVKSYMEESIKHIKKN